MIDVLSYGIDSDDLLVRVGGDWDAFSSGNDAPDLTESAVLGTSIWDHVIGAETRQLYQTLFRNVRRIGAVAEVPFRCDAPTRRRFMELEIVPLAEDGLDLNSRLIREELRDSVPLLDLRLTRGRDVLVVCSWCRRVSMPEGRWVEAEEALAELRLFEMPLPRLSHGVCPDCLATMKSD